MILLLEAVGVVVLVLLSAFLLRRQEAFFEARVIAQDTLEEERRVALYKQQKATSQAVAKSDRAVRRLADQATHLHDEIKLTNQRADALLREVKHGE